MKIAFFTNSILEGGGGLAKYFIDTSANLIKFFPQLDISIITLNEDFVSKLNILLSIYYFKDLIKGKVIKEKTEDITNKLGKVKYIKCSSLNSLKEELKKYDVIYSKNEILEAFTLKYLIGYKNLPPIIFGCHTPIYYPIAKSFHAKLHNFLYNSFVYRYLTNGVKKFHVINSGDETRLGKLFPKKLIVKIYYPFDFDHYLKEGIFQYNHKFDKDKINILWTGRLVEQKGVDDLVKIVNTVNESGYIKKIIWNICGDGAEKDKILDLIKWQNVNYLDYVENKYMPSIYKQNSLFISTSHWEGFPYNLLEAQSAGLPVLAYNVSGCNDIIDNKVNGILVEDINQFKNEILNFIDGKYKFCGINKYIVKKFNQDLIYKQLINLFRSVEDKNIC